MNKKLFGINIDIELKSRLDSIAKSEGKSSSGIINGLIFKYVEEFIPTPPKEPTPEKPKMTEEERLAEWEWRKGQVAQGKQPAWFGEEDPIQPRESMKELAEFFKPYE